MQIEIRKATVKDISGLHEVMKVISDNGVNAGLAPKLIEKISENEEKCLLVAVDKETDTIVGSIFGMVFEDICGEGRPILLVENVAVLENMQNKGIGKLMFDAVEDWARRFNCHYEMLVSGNARIGAHKFYKKIGFDEVKGYKKYL